MPAKKWKCICGQKNEERARFCQRCGRKRPDSPLRSERHIQPPAVNADNSIFHKNIEQKSVQPPAPSAEPTAMPQVNQPYNGGQYAAPNKGESKFYKNGFIAICAALRVLAAVLLYTNYQSTLQANHTTQQTQQTQQQAKKDGDRPDRDRQMKTDLSLGGIDLGMTTDEVHKVLGKEDDVEVRNGLTFLEYPNLEIGTRTTGVVCSLVSNGSVETKRHMKEGMTYSDMCKKYGKDYAKMEWGDKILYEYTFTSMRGEKGLLRFAIRKSDNKVDYISVRIPD